MPDTIGRYQIKSELGRGGMATVYLAHDPSFGRDVAIKVLPPQFLHDPTFRGRFEREARIVANLEHPAITPVYDFGEDNGQPFLVMRYMAGRSLADRMQAGPLPLPDITRVIERIGSALDYAHRQGIVHRDLKPGNILFDQSDDAFLSDFGIVKLAEATINLTAGGILGTPSYMSPEQIHGSKTIDGRSDIYSLGVIAFEMLTGQAPYKAKTPAQLMMKHILEPVPDIQKVKRDLPGSCQQVIDRAMAKERNQRFHTAQEMTLALQGAIGRPAAAPPTEAAGGDLEATMLEPIPATPAGQPPPQAAPLRTAPLSKDSAAAPEWSPADPAAKSPVAVQPAARRRWPLFALLGGCVGLPVLLGLCVVAYVVITNLNQEPRVVVRQVTATSDFLATADAEEAAGTATARVVATATSLAATEAAQATAFALTAEAEATARAVVIATQEAAASRLNEAKSWPMFMADGFNNNINDWCDGPSSAERLEGSRELLNGQYIWQAEAITDFVWWCAPSGTELSGDIFVTVDTELQGGVPNTSMGLVFHRLDNDNLYLFRIQNNGWYQFLVLYEDEWETLIEWAETSLIRPGNVNRIAVVAVASHFTFFINDIHLTEFDDDRLSTGRVGLVMGLFDEGDTATISFDNLEIRTP